MEYRSLGSTSLKVSEICLGTMQFLWSVNEKNSFTVLDAFLDAGGNFLDTADMYSQWVPGLKGGESEQVIGQWMTSRKTRSKIVLATKVRCRRWEGKDGEGLGKTHILRACEESLQRLQTDRIDLYQSHWPDDETPVDETLEAYGLLIKQGKVRYAGCSNYDGAEMKAAVAAGKKTGTAYACVQPHYNLIFRKDFETEVLPIVRKQNLGVIPYSPLEGGFLTGKYRKGKDLPGSVRAERIKKERWTDKNFAVVDALESVARKNGKTILQAALAWLLSHEWMTAPIIGANSVEQLNESLGAAGFRLSPADKKTLDDASAGL